MKTMAGWQKALDLEPHPEGGFYKRMEQSDIKVIVNNTEKVLFTSIYFLLTVASPSHFHRLQADEIWYYHDGAPLTVHCIFSDGRYKAIKVGKDIEKGERLSYLVPRGTIFGSSVQQDFSLVSCVVAPGFEFRDFELFTQAQLLSDYPQHGEIIKRLAYETIPTK